MTRLDATIILQYKTSLSFVSFYAEFPHRQEQPSELFLQKLGERL